MDTSGRLVLPSLGAELDLCKLQPSLQGLDRAGLIAGAAGDLDLVPAGLAAQRDKNAGLENLDPAAALDGVVLAVIQSDDFGASQHPGKAHQQHGPVAQPAQVVAERREHGQKLVRPDRLHLFQRSGMAAADADENARDVLIAPVEPKVALRVAPRQSGKTAIDPGYRQRACLTRRRGEIGDVEPDQFGRRGQGVGALHSTPTREGLQVARVGGSGVLGNGVVEVLAGGVDQTVEAAGARDVIGQDERRGMFGVFRRIRYAKRPIIFMSDKPRLPDMRDNRTARRLKCHGMDKSAATR